MCLGRDGYFRQVVGKALWGSDVSSAIWMWRIRPCQDLGGRILQTRESTRKASDAGTTFAVDRNYKKGQRSQAEWVSGRMFGNEVGGAEQAADLAGPRKSCEKLLYLIFVLKRSLTAPRRRPAGSRGTANMEGWTKSWHYFKRSHPIHQIFGYHQCPNYIREVILI